MFDELVRVRVAPVLGPPARWLARRGVTPTQVTLAAFGTALAAAGATAGGYAAPAALLWLMSRAGDGLDGVIARESSRVSARGGYLDITLDMAAYSAMLVAFAARRPELGLVWACILAGYVLAITTTLALAGAAERARRTVSRTNRTYQFTPALAEGGETTLVYVAWLLFPAFTAPVAWTWCIVLLLSAIQRSILAWRTLD